MVYLIGKGLQLSAVGKLQFLVVREVKLEFEEGSEFEELLPQAGELRAEVSAQLAHGHAVCGLVGGSDEIGYGFSLREVHLAVQVGAAGVFAGLGLAASVVDEELQHLAEDVSAAVAGYLDAVLSGVTVGRAEEADEHFVDHSVLPVVYVAVGDGVGVLLVERLGVSALGREDLFDRADGLRT